MWHAYGRFTRKRRATVVGLISFKRSHFFRILVLVDRVAVNNVDWRRGIEPLSRFRTNQGAYLNADNRTFVVHWHQIPYKIY
jgi:hypothetical protein